MSSSEIRFKPMYLISAQSLHRYKRIEKLFLAKNKEPKVDHIGYGNFEFEAPDYVVEPNRVFMPENVDDPGPSTSGVPRASPARSVGAESKKSDQNKNTSKPKKVKKKKKKPSINLKPWYFVGSSDAEINLDEEK